MKKNTWKSTCAREPVNMQKRTYGQAFGVSVQKKPYLPNTTGMVMYRKPNQYSLTNPRQKSLAPEKKNVDVSGSVGTAAGSSWSEIDLLNGVAAGTGPTDRIGRKTQMKSLVFRWQTSSSASVFPIRIMIVYDRQPSGVIPVVSEILSAVIPSPSDPNFISNMNLDNSDRFVILADEIDQPPSLILTTNGTPLRTGKIYRKINLPTVFTNPGANIADISTGAVYIFTCVLGSVPNSLAGIGYNSRIRYTDV